MGWKFEMPMRGKDQKKKIEYALQNEEDVKVLKEMIEEYEHICPLDFDLYGIKVQYCLLTGDLEEADRIMREMIRKNPYNWEANVIAENVCCAEERWFEAIRYETIIQLLHSLYPKLPCGESRIEQLNAKIIQQQENNIRENNRTELLQCKKNVERLRENMDTFFGLLDETYYRSVSPVVGKVYKDIFGNEKYNAVYESVDEKDMLEDPAIMSSVYGNYIFTKLECRETKRQNNIVLGMEADYLLPILQETEGVYRIIPPGEDDGIVCANKRQNHFEYYRLPPGTRVEADQELQFGIPVALRADSSKKKLVLNIFVDGISQKVIAEENLAKLMPNTFRFFSKGVLCQNAYSCAEWTLPSLASYWSGLSSKEHMVIHQILTKPLPAEYTTLAEYFKEQGYETAKIDGDWRSTQVYGYSRGVDRIIYQRQDMGMRAEQVIPDVLDHMKLMKETNQFIWMCVGDLHDIADGFSGTASEQAAISFRYRALEETGKTSVKQHFSRNKREAYMQKMRHIDDYLEILYRFIEENYQENDILISLFGDHGQGYLVGEEEHFLSEGRSKVGMMFRGGGVQGECKELISTCDYLPILCKLAGIPLKDEGIDGRLPVFFGGDEERQYVITESIHEGDPYQAAIVSKEDAFYFTAEGMVGYDGRFTLGDYTCTLLDQTGAERHDTDRIEYYFNILIDHIGSLLIL